MNSPDSQRPEAVYGGMIPTKNQRGFMSEKMEYFSSRFAEYAGTLDSESLDVGCAYGVATLAALRNGARVLACDMEAAHIEVLRNDTPPDLASRLRTEVGSLPDIDFQANSFGAILCARVFHFLLAAEIRESLHRMYAWLSPGGRLFLIGDTPYTGFWSTFAPEYEKRKADGEEWPGLIENIGTLLQDGKVPDGMLPYLNTLDPDILSRECEAAGFVVEEAGFTGRENDREGRHHAGVIALKPPAAP